MPFTASDSTKHTKLADTPKKRKQWAEVANSIRERCLSKGGDEKKCDASGIKAANGVLKNAGASLEQVDWILHQLNGDEVSQEMIFDYIQRLTSPVVSETVVETLELGEGRVLEILEEESHLAFIHEEAFSFAQVESTGSDDKTLDEAKGEKRAVFRALQGSHDATSESGISKNKNFYPGDVAESLAPMLEARPKMYLDHKQLTPMGRQFKLTQPWRPCH